MILLMGECGAGKTTLAKELSFIIPNSCVIDADIIREYVYNFGYSDDGRRNNMRLCLNIARNMESLCVFPIVALQAPFKDIRNEMLTPTDFKVLVINDNNTKKKQNEKRSDWITPVYTWDDADLIVKFGEEDCINKILSKIIW